jgi:outer membrane protein OmpA-like peptidoglycan-associated protein
MSVSVFAQDDAPGCKDSPLFNRMPNMVIGLCSSNFDEMEIPMNAENIQKKEGTKTFIQYNYSLEEATAPSFFQIVKNFENAIIKTGGKRIYYSKEAGVATLFTQSAGKDIWVVLNDGAGAKLGNFELSILEIEGMKQDIAAGEMLEALNKTGSIALYINFETGKSVIKPESQSTIDQVAQLLTENKALKISVEGHTDNVGAVQTNQTLSENRAKAVMNAVAAKGIDKSRLVSKGWGQSKPIADNNTEDGKAKNRRVEIVKF